ncbi:hypothetical protein ATN79_15180 [Paraburkholderia caribensis]|nr:hypothetical protein ATN79_15180 [Paraburkholderia caribensis]CAG9191342.1 conserved hypothetical protein [Paraburkholderia caribensis]
MPVCGSQTLRLATHALAADETRVIARGKRLLAQNCRLAAYTWPACRRRIPTTRFSRPMLLIALFIALFIEQADSSPCRTCRRHARFVYRL